jgi:hypothetical protein
MSLLAIVVVGAGLVSAAFSTPVRGTADRIFRGAAALALGIGAWSATYAAWRMAFGVAGVSKDVILALLGVVLLFLRPRLPPGEPGDPDPAPRWLWILFAAACAIAAGAFIEHTVRFPDGGWDAWMIWNLRARFLARAPDLPTAFSPEMSYLAHQDYPWLLPGMLAQAFAVFGESRWLPAAVAALYGVLGVIVVAAALSRAHGARYGLLGALAVVTLPGYAVYAWSQQADILVAVYLALAIALIGSRSPRELALAGFAAGLGMWTKNEGALYAVCLAAALIVRTRDLRGTGAFVAGAVPCAVLLAWFKLRFGPQTDLAAFSTAESVLAHAADARRWGELVLFTLRRVFYFQEAGLWVAAELLALALVVRKRPPSVAGSALFLACAVYAPIYVLQPHPLEWIFRTSAMRILIQLWPSAVLATMPALVRAAESEHPVPAAELD